jgi:hypothetical protein
MMNLPNSRFAGNFSRARQLPPTKAITHGSALLRGLEIEQNIGVNPYKFGMIGAVRFAHGPLRRWKKPISGEKLVTIRCHRIAEKHTDPDHFSQHGKCRQEASPACGPRQIPVKRSPPRFSVKEVYATDRAAYRAACFLEASHL